MTTASDIVRILTGLMAMLSQAIFQIPATRPTPVPTVPRPTFTIAAPATNTPQPTFTPVPPTSTRIPTATATATRGVVRDNNDPMGILADGDPPKQKLASAVLIYPLISSKATEETLIEILNASNSQVTVKCHYVNTTSCNGVDFFVRLTAQQPIAWTASTGRDGNGNRVAPPTTGESTLKCFVQPTSTATSAYNTIYGRAIVSDNTGQTIGYSAIGFRRLSAGTFSGSVRLDGRTYESCADRLHFTALANQTGSDSELILVPCEEDLLRIQSTTSAVQFAVINEFEEHFSGSTSLKCYKRQRFSTIPAFRRSSVGTDTIHAIVRSVSMPVIGMVIDRFTVPGSGAASTSANMPYLEGSRAATITIPDDEF